MFWVIQNNMFSESNYRKLILALKRLGIPYAEVQILPEFDLLLPTDFDSRSYTGTMEDIKEVVVDNSGPVMISGSFHLAQIAKNRGWEPGSFLNEHFEFPAWKLAYGVHLLNHDSLVASFSSIDPPWETFFIRPCEDSKIFDGTIITRDAFNSWRKDQLPFQDDLVAASPTRKIFAEFRFFVVDGHVITSSQYKRGGVLFASSDVDPSAKHFVEEMICIWQPAPAFVIDIAQTEEGYKIVEINNINSAGFYEADVTRLVDAICTMKLEMR